MTIRYCLIALLALLLTPASVQAQTTFAVTVDVPTANNPRPEPWSVVYYVDGSELPELTLTRGETYVFDVGSGAAFHPFYISTSEVGGGAGVWEEGVTGNFATTGETLTFTVPMGAPDLLYYECGNHPRMGWQLNIVNATSTEEGTQPETLTLGAPYPNPFADRTAFTVQLGTPQPVSVEVFGVDGRRVAVLHDGMLSSGPEHLFTLDGAGLADGVYLVRVQTIESVVERRVTLAR